MELGREVKIGTSETVIITSDGGAQSIKVSKTRLNLSSPMPFVECSGELSTISIGLYGVKLSFDIVGEFLYKIEIGDDVEYIKIKVVEMTNNDMIKDILQDINIKLDRVETEDDAVFTDILRYLKIINARL